MTKEEREYIDNRILVLDIKIENEEIHTIDDTFFGTSEENFALLEKGMMAFKMFLNEKYETTTYAYCANAIKQLEDLFRLISRY